MTSKKVKRGNGTVNWDRLSPMGRYRYSKSLEIVSHMRGTGKTIDEAIQGKFIDPQTVIENARPALKRRAGHWYATKTDDLVRPPMNIIQNGRLVGVTVKGSRNASKIGRYFSSIAIFTETGNVQPLQAFKGKYVTDVKGRRHYFETDPAMVLEAIRKTREPDYPEPYRYGG